MRNVDYNSYFWKLGDSDTGIIFILAILMAARNHLQVIIISALVQTLLIFVLPDKISVQLFSPIAHGPIFAYRFCSLIQRLRAVCALQPVMQN